ncbi:MAG: phage terminase small subunit P27 family [Phycisphaerae bacterium]|nr:phage terminase small subunit P27 family [Phycisphaerae bacterium]
MGRRGPAPTPTAILKLRGSWRGNVNRREPKPATGAPPCPMWLSPAAKEVWDQMIDQMASLNMVTQVDEKALARYCDAFIRWKAAAAFLDKNGEVYTLKDAAGKVKCVMPFPQMSTYKGMAVLLLKLEQEFGLTPASRSRIQVSPESEKPSDNKARFFGAG